MTAVKAVQRGNGFAATGVVGPRFWRLLQSGRLKPGRNASPAPAVKGVSATAGSSKGAVALAFAKRQLGDSYGHGGTGPNRWDCSGLTQGAYKAAGSAAAQFPRTRAMEVVSKSSLKPVTWCSSLPVRHVAIYAAAGKGHPRIPPASPWPITSLHAVRGGPPLADPASHHPGRSGPDGRIRPDSCVCDTFDVMGPDSPRPTRSRAEPGDHACQYERSATRPFYSRQLRPVCRAAARGVRAGRRGRRRGGWFCPLLPHFDNWEGAGISRDYTSRRPSRPGPGHGPAGRAGRESGAARVRPGRWAAELNQLQRLLPRVVRSDGGVAVDRLAGRPETGGRHRRQRAGERPIQ